MEKEKNVCSTVNYAALGHFFDVLGHLFCSIIDLTVYNHGLYPLMMFEEPLFCVIRSYSGQMYGRISEKWGGPKGHRVAQSSIVYGTTQ